MVMGWCAARCSIPCRFSEARPGMAWRNRADSRRPSDLRVHRRSGRKLRDRVFPCRAKRDPADAGSVRQTDPGLGFFQQSPRLFWARQFLVPLFLLWRGELGPPGTPPFLGAKPIAITKADEPDLNQKADRPASSS